MLAERLTEDKSSVAVIEAGSFYEITNGNFSSIPGYATTYNAKSPSDTSPGADWGYTTIPQTVRCLVMPSIGPWLTCVDT